MTKNESFFKDLSPSKIDSSIEIKSWLSQFSEDKQSLAKLLLSRLKFVSIDKYSEWINKAVHSIINTSSFFALYSVRKLSQSGDYPTYWNTDKKVISRPGESLGSEDLVYSLIKNLVRSNKENLLDHPSLDELKKKKVRDYILIDDSIGSGDRISKFINSMLEHPTFFSWWNLGLVRFHIISFYRFYESENKIILNIRGKDRIKQKIKKSSKITFISKFVYNQNWINTRWGENYENLIDLCKSNSPVPSNKRLGYGDVFSNIIFYHSVPNNTPGIIWFSKKNKWEPLMPNRTVPTWLINLLEINENTIAPQNIFSDEILNTLVLIKKGVKKTNSVSQRLGVDVKYTIKLLNHMKIMRLIDENNRLTSRGLDILHKNRKISLPDWNYKLYIPKSWCADKKTFSHQ